MHFPLDRRTASLAASSRQGGRCTAASFGGVGEAHIDVPCAYFASHLPLGSEKEALLSPRSQSFEVQAVEKQPFSFDDRRDEATTWQICPPSGRPGSWREPVAAPAWAAWVGPLAGWTLSRRMREVTGGHALHAPLPHREFHHESDEP